jgi:hypothetical protein
MNSITCIPSPPSPSFTLPLLLVPPFSVRILQSCFSFLTFKLILKRVSQCIPALVFFNLVDSPISITLIYPFILHSPFCNSFNTHAYFLNLHRSYVLWYFQCSITPFPYPSFSLSHRVVPFLQTCSISGFIYDQAYFCGCVYLLDLFSMYEQKG